MVGYTGIIHYLLQKPVLVMRGELAKRSMFAQQGSVAGVRRTTKTGELSLARSGLAYLAPCGMSVCNHYGATDLTK